MAGLDGSGEPANRGSEDSRPWEGPWNQAGSRLSIPICFSVHIEEHLQQDYVTTSIAELLFDLRQADIGAEGKLVKGSCRIH
jgi:hypothetical protein